MANIMFADCFLALGQVHIGDGVSCHLSCKALPSAKDCLLSASSTNVNLRRVKLHGKGTSANR